MPIVSEQTVEPTKSFVKLLRRWSPIDRFCTTIARAGVSEPLFLDHVHFTLAGNSLIASLIVENILDQQERNPRPPSKNPTLGFTRFDRHGF